MKMFIFIGILMMIVSEIFAHEQQNRFVVEDIQEYFVPTGIEIRVSGKVMSADFMHRVVSPKKPKEISIEIKCIEGKDVGRLNKLTLKKGSTFSLPFGKYDLARTNYALTIEEMVNDQKNIRKIPNSELMVPPGLWVPRKVRPLKIYCYPQDSLVTIRGRLVDSTGNGVSGVSVKGGPNVNDPYDAVWYLDSETLTGETGAFEFKDIPPASLDLAVRFLLFGRIMKSSYDSERLFDFSWWINKTPKSCTAIRREFKVPLISEQNLRPLLELSAHLRKINAMSDKETFRFIDEDMALQKLPVSTNNVVYVGDIVLPEKRMIKND